MACRPHDRLIDGELDNTVPGKVTGWMRFEGLPEKVIFDLKGDCHRDIRGTKIRLKGEAFGRENVREDAPPGRGYMDRFSLKQTGRVGDITAGRPPRDYLSYPYIEWYSDANGRAVLELDKSQIRVIGKPLAAAKQEPVDRVEQHENMLDFLSEMVAAVKTKKPVEAVLVAPTGTKTSVKRSAKKKAPPKPKSKASTLKPRKPSKKAKS